MLEEPIKLPKQWKHWCRQMHLCPHKSRGRHWPWLYLQGRGHYWRVNCHGMFQRGDTYETFDRWARCEITEVPLLRTRAEFVTAVTLLAWPKL